MISRAKMNSVSEILAEHKKNLPAKYDKKGQPIIVGSDELPQPISITERQKRGSHHFHFQHGPYERRFAMIARNHTRWKVALTCMHLKCSGRVSLIPKKQEMIKCVGERETSNGHKKGKKIQKIYAINWDCWTDLHLPVNKSYLKTIFLTLFLRFDFKFRISIVVLPRKNVLSRKSEKFFAKL